MRACADKGGSFMTSRQPNSGPLTGVARRAASAAISFPLLLIALTGFTLGGCQPPPVEDDIVPASLAPDPIPAPKPITWSPAFDTADVGALSAVWGSSPTNVFIVVAS